MEKEEIKKTNKEIIQSFSDRDLAMYLFERGNYREYCDSICAYCEECEDFSGSDDNDEFCIEQICKWLNSINEEELVVMKLYI